jgi:predicted  nucleic acid-binding Zn-ribbon protein
MTTSVQWALNIEKLEVKLKNSEAFKEKTSRSISTAHAEITKIKEQLMEPWSKTTKLESSVKAHDEEHYKRKITTISSSPMISETDTIIL